MKAYRVKVRTENGKEQFLDVLAFSSMDAAMTASAAHDYLCAVSVVVA